MRLECRRSRNVWTVTLVSPKDEVRLGSMLTFPFLVVDHLSRWTNIFRLFRDDRADFKFGRLFCLQSEQTPFLYHYHQVPTPTHPLLFSVGIDPDIPPPPISSRPVKLFLMNVMTSVTTLACRRLTNASKLKEKKGGRGETKLETSQLRMTRPHYFWPQCHM